MRCIWLQAIASRDSLTVAEVEMFINQPASARLVSDYRQNRMKARDLVKDSLGNLVSVFSKRGENCQRLLFERSEFRRCF